jgi:iron(III) transport system substrate-binding protein
MWVGKLLVVVLFVGAWQLSYAQQVNIYSARNEALIKPLLDRFTAETGIKVNLVTGDADALIKRLELEKDNSPADILLTVDVARLYRAKQTGLLQAVQSDRLQAVIPSTYRDPEGYWYGMSLRSRVIVYAKDRVDPARLSSYEALSDPEWQRKLCVRSSSNVYNQSLVASMIANDGIEATEQWAKALVANFARPPTGGDRDLIKAVAVGQCDLALVNTYYLAGMIESSLKEENDAAAKVVVFWPNQADRGAHINVSGAGITRAAKHVEEAVRLLEFMVNEQSQYWYAETNYEFPVRTDVEKSELLKQWGEFKADQLALDQLGINNADAVRLMDRAGWK